MVEKSIYPPFKKTKKTIPTLFEAQRVLLSKDGVMHTENDHPWKNNPDFNPPDMVQKHKPTI
ncbi:MAG: hypothetical protein ACD_46C00194G0010 [uncultured bacterium]|nr:MAG: hypothetical protein ACD_46C00194G0010 [uncultured bacterium]